MAALDSSFPKKGDEENKISVDIINDDQALAAEFEKMTDNENYADNIDDLESRTLIRAQINEKNKDYERLKNLEASGALQVNDDGDGDRK